MFTPLKKYLRWGSSKNSENQRLQTFHIFIMMKGVLEDILFWKKMWISLFFILFLNILFFVCIYKQINILELTLLCYAIFITIDAFEVWLKYKHRTTCLKRLADHDGIKLNTIAEQVKNWMYIKWSEFMYLRETNHTKAFLLMNMVLGVVLMIGKFINGYFLSYLVSMLLCTLYKLIPPVIKIVRKLQLNTDPDMEFDGLIPELSEIDIKLLSIEPEADQIFDERQSLDYWKPDDLPLEEASDSSDSISSSSLVTNFSMEKVHTFEKDVEPSDSSEDEYIPIDPHKDKLQSTVEVIERTASWSSSAYNALWNITGAVTSMMYTKSDDNKRKQVESIDSSDGFEIIDKRDVM